MWDKLKQGFNVNLFVHDAREGSNNNELLSLITKLGEQIMSAISDFAAKQNVFNDRQDAAITDLQGDVQSLNDQIAALQASTGTITPEDQALLDGITTRSQAVADKLDALDALTPPVVPKA